jgi:hypothetical protein
MACNLLKGRSMRLTSLFAALPAASLLMTGCVNEPLVGDGDRTKIGYGKDDVSAEAIFVDFEFDAELLTGSAWNPKSQIEDQLLYTIGHLNGDRAVGRLDQLQLSDIETEAAGDQTLIRYHARLPVAWGDKDDYPESYTFKLPKDVSYGGQSAFTDSYSHDCVDWGAHDVTPGSMWYYYRPNAYRCDLAADDIVTVEAAVTLSEVNTTGKYPEYHKVWEDDALEVLAVFGKYEDGATTASDAGIAGFNRFSQSVAEELRGYDLVTEPAELPSAPGIDHPELIFRATLPDGKTVRVVALLVDNIRTAPTEFNQRYEELSTRADLIIYNGHAGLGANIRAMARKGRWAAGQYAIMFINGCDTYAYVDSALIDAHAAINDDDPTGTKYVDIVTNALPSYFRSMPNATMALVRGLMSHDTPQTYEQIFGRIDRSQVVLVSGEQDNVYVPGFGDDDDPVDPPADWTGLSEAGTVAADDEVRWETPVLPAGSYRFDMTGTRDADLYVRVGTAPTTELFDCRPFKTGSNESCVVDLPSPTTIHVMVRGWASSSDFELEGVRE